MAAKRSKKFKKTDYFTLIIAVIIIAVAIFVYLKNENDEGQKFTGIDEVFSTSNVTVANTDQLNIHFIDVGQGDCIFIELPDGKNILIDSGDRGKHTQIIDYLDNLNVKEITLVIATHSDADHIAGMDEIFAEYDIKYCLRPFVYYNGEDKSAFEDSFNLPSGSKNKFDCSTSTYKNFLEALINENCGWEFFNKDSDFIQKFTYNGVESEYSLDFYTPIESVPNIGYKDPNDYSPIMVFSYGEFKIMFTGDAEKVAESELLNAYSNLPDVNVLKVGHHGSATSTAPELLDAITPEEAVIMCGQGNKHSHPRAETMKKLKDRSILPYRTDLQGNIVISVLSSGSYEFITERFVNLTELYKGITPSVD